MPTHRLRRAAAVSSVVLFLALGGLRGGKSWEISRENPEIGEMMVAGWWFGTFFLKFFHILEIVTPTDELIFQRGGSTTNQ